MTLRFRLSSRNGCERLVSVENMPANFTEPSIGNASVGLG